MSEQELKINVTANTKELVIRNGSAKEIFDISRMLIDASIKAPAQFMGVRGSNKDTDHVLFSRGAQLIEYIFNERFPEGGSIIGRLRINPELDSIHILDGRLFGTKELAQLLKRNRVFFKDREENAKIVTLLNNFTATIQAEIEASQDTRGNKKSMVDKTVKTNMPTEFSLEMPLFIGFEKKSFRVEICFDSTDSSVRCWMESPDLIELMILERDRIIDEQLKPFIAAGLAVIEK